MTDRDGGPAFPMQTDAGWDETGMSKLLWLAAHAPHFASSEFVSSGHRAGKVTLMMQENARQRFKWAQAMLAREAEIMGAGPFTVGGPGVTEEDIK